MRAVLTAALLTVAGAVFAQTNATPGPKIINLTDEFVEAYDRNANKSEADFVKDFRASVEPAFPQFYGIDRYAGKKTREQRDKEIGDAFKEFPSLRSAYVDKSNAFATELPKHIATFVKHFPDYKPSTIYLVHTLGEMDGGQRTLSGKVHFIFGPDAMVKYHAPGARVAPFFHHELFHDYRSLKCEGGKIWTHLWVEGLATYVAKTLTPDASIPELSLNIPENMVPGVRAAPRQAWTDLKARLDDGRGPSYENLFRNIPDNTGLPARRGYYLGFLVAQEVSKKYSLQQVAQLGCEQVRQEVHEAVDKLTDRPIH